MNFQRKKIFLAVIIPFFLGCGSLPVLEREEKPYLSREKTADTQIGIAVSAQTESRPGKNGIYALEDPLDAFAARMQLVEAAEKTLDVQYYIWRRDKTGLLFMEALLQAAQRGVQVRLLLDDLGTGFRDEELIAYDSHPNMSIRLFNPFTVRRPKSLGFLTDFHRVYRRMHNKSFTADKQASIVGGRNIGDDYFGACEGHLWVDLDALMVGPVAFEINEDFSRYWHSRSAYPVDKVTSRKNEYSLKRLSGDIREIVDCPSSAEYIDALKSSDIINLFLNEELDLEWARVRMISDDPAKGLGEAKGDGLLINQLEELIGEPSEEVALVSPYFVPTRVGTEFLRRLTDKGIRIRILTNSLEATNYISVHAGYKRFRRDLLEAEAELYELRHIVEYEGVGPPGSPPTSLHAKTFAVDGKRIFIGSFNFNPRSANRDTELGFIIESSYLAKQIHEAFDSIIPLNSYQALLNEQGRLYWIEGYGENLKYYSTEPRAGLWRRYAAGFLSLLPVERFL